MSLRLLSVGAFTMKRIKKLIVPAALFAIAGVSGCNGHGSYETGLPVIDRWISPGAMMEPGVLEYADPPNNTRPPPVPAPDPPSDLLRPGNGNRDEPKPRLILPTLPKTSEVSAPGRDDAFDVLDAPFVEDEVGYTPVPGL